MTGFFYAGLRWGDGFSFEPVHGWLGIGVVLCFSHWRGFFGMICDLFFVCFVGLELF
jgi:hypothetical protein